MPGDKAVWYLCTASKSPLFKVGVAYEVYHHTADGHAVIINEGKGGGTELPFWDATFVPHYPGGEPR